MTDDMVRVVLDMSRPPGRQKFQTTEFVDLYR